MSDEEYDALVAEIEARLDTTLVGHPVVASISALVATTEKMLRFVAIHDAEAGLELNERVTAVVSGFTSRIISLH